MSRYVFTWTGEAMVPLSRHAKACDESYVIGQRYWLTEENDRSLISQNHQFAWLADAWKTLPECYAQEFPSPEHLRKRALIDAGFYDEQLIEVGSLDVAITVARAIGAREPFSVVFARESFVVIRTARSQSKNAMGAKQFQESKQAVLEIVSQMIGVTPEQLLQEVGKAA